MTVPQTSQAPRAFPADPYRGLPSIITASDGVYQVSPDGTVTQLLQGAVAFAIDDGQGGLLYQLDRGRNWDEAPGFDTTIWWVEAGTTDPKALLVPTRTDGHELSLHDGFVRNGLHVVYTRHEGRKSDLGWPFSISDRVRAFDSIDRTAIDLTEGSAWEAGIGSVQCGDGVIAYTRYDQIGGTCEFLDYQGAAVAIPAVAEEFDCEGDCPTRCAIGWNGELLMFSRELLPGRGEDGGTLVVFTDAHTAEEIARVVHVGTDLRVEHVDLLGNRVSMSWSTEHAVIYDMAHLVDGPTILPIEGIARFAKAAVDLPGIVRLG